jgi:hypothetical protein
VSQAAREAICEKYDCQDGDIAGLKDCGGGEWQVTFAWGRSMRVLLEDAAPADPEPEEDEVVEFSMADTKAALIDGYFVKTGEAPPSSWTKQQILDAISE